MVRIELPEFDIVALKDTVAAASFSRGALYARQHAVVRVGWDPAENALDGTVRGSSGEFYETTAYFMPSRWSALVFERGQCSCPVGLNCKHVVALVLTAANPRVVASRGRQQPVGWEQSLRSLFGSPTAAGATPLAVELTLMATRGSSLAASVSARLVRPGRNGWVSGGLTWTSLGNSYETGEFLPEQVRLLRELYALYRSGQSGYSIGRRRSTSPRSAAGSCGRCSPRQPRSGCGWCTPASGSATWRRTAWRSCVWTPAAASRPGRSSSLR